ncbi:hypothetical protein M3Y97_00996800 [Aphelenchoides bicaudatus]|nr:hypothetical protein M3Y97_00996800 [Aphelenchoides bicaudatus]
MKIELLLLLFAIQLDCFSSKQLNHLLKEKLVGSSIEKPKNIDPPAGPYCQSLVAYFVGTLQNTHSTNTGPNVQFQVRLNADTNTKRIFVDADEWNEQYSKSSDFEIDFYYEGKIVVQSSMLDINGPDGNFYHLLYFPFFNNSFVLNKPKGTCTKHQLDDLSDDGYLPDLDELSVCVCCGEYDPSDLLGCPNNKWSSEKVTTTSAPTCPTTSALTCPAQKPCPTNQPIVPTTQKPSKPVTCKNVIAYFKGIFQNNAYPNRILAVDFQVSLSAHDLVNKTYFTIEYWNNDIMTNINQNSFYFMYFANFNNSFTFDSIDGKCTNNVPSYPNVYGPDTSLFNACVCCDQYSPDAALSCPYKPT